MEKKRKPDWIDIFSAVWKAVLAALVLFALGVFALSALVYNGAAGLESIPYLLYAVYSVAAFGATAFLSVFSRGQLLLKGLLAQGIFLVLLLFSGLSIYAAEVNWLRLAAAAGAALLSTAAAVLLFGKRKKKNFRKNTTIRLKKK